MTEPELRQLVRDAIARAGVTPSAVGRDREAAPPRTHASFALLNLPDGADSDGPCIIEPAVGCNHCGYCKSYGH
jgi:hypothetical protein